VREASLVLRIRPYEVDDLTSATELSLRAFEPVFASLRQVLGPAIFERLHPDWRSDQRTAVHDVLTDGTTQAWVAEDGDRVVGFAALRFDTLRRLGEIAMLAVDPAAQRAGVGSALTHHALARLEQAGMAVAMVETGGDPGHGPARATYQKAGFSPLPVVRYFTALGTPDLAPQRDSQVATRPSNQAKSQPAAGQVT